MSEVPVIQGERSVVWTKVRTAEVERSRLIYYLFWHILEEKWTRLVMI
jgi:hypothetical protein